MIFSSMFNAGVVELVVIRWVLGVSCIGQGKQFQFGFQSFAACGHFETIHRHTLCEGNSISLLLALVHLTKNGCNVLRGHGTAATCWLRCLGRPAVVWTYGC